MTCKHCGDVITVSEMDGLNCYVSIFLLSASDFKFMKFLVWSCFPQIVFTKITRVLLNVESVPGIKISVFKETWGTVYRIVWVTG